MKALLLNVLFTWLYMVNTYQDGGSVFTKNWLKFEANSSISDEILVRHSIHDWNRLFSHSKDNTMDQTCGKLIIQPWSSAVRATSFCYNGLVSFEVCRNLLIKSSNCNGFNFIDWDIYKWKKFMWWQKGMGICKLFDRADYGVEIFTDRSFMNNSVVVLKMTSTFDNCTVSGNYKEEKVNNNLSIDVYKEILNSSSQSDRYFKLNSLISNLNDLKVLPNFHIIIYVTELWYSHNRYDMNKIASHWSCYVEAHNYLFTLSVLPSMTAAEFFMTRHKYTLHKYLRTAKNVLVMDADSIVLNMAVPFDRYLERSADYSVQLQYRENGEITAGAFIFKNDIYSAAFLDYWLSYYPPSPPSPEGPWDRMKHSIIDNPNSDNGALIAAIAVFALAQNGKEDLYYDCLSSAPGGLHTYPEQYCFSKFLTTIYHTFGPGSRIPTPGRIRVWWHREGFWRTATRVKDDRSQIDKDTFDTFYAFCYPSSDLIGNGDKNFSEVLEPYQSSTCNITKVLDPISGKNPFCRWLSQAEEISLLRKHCQWRSPACIVDSKPDVPSEIPHNRTNICLYIPNNSSAENEPKRIFNHECKMTNKLTNLDELKYIE